MPSADGILLDTHALLWWKAGSGRLPETALAHITAARRVLLSPITCWEIAMLVGKKRVELDRPTATWMRDLLAEGGIALADLTPPIAVLAAELPDFHGDPADRLIYATARALDVPLLSKDRTLHRYAESGPVTAVVW